MHECLIFGALVSLVHWCNLRDQLPVNIHKSMPLISPIRRSFVKKVHDSFSVGVEYHEVPRDSDYLECTVKLINNTAEKSPPLTASTAEEAVEDDTEECVNTSMTGNTENGNASAGDTGDTGDIPSSGWFSFFSQGKLPITPPPLSDLQLLLGYVQLFGFVRLNSLIGTNGVSDAAHSLYWQNQEYLDQYESQDAQEKLDAVMSTPFYQNYGGQSPKLGRVAGIPDLNAGSYDSVLHTMLLDLVYNYGSVDATDAVVPEQQALTALCEEVRHSFVPFYVTAQSLLFSNIEVKRKSAKEFRLRLPVPGPQLPPSYNCKLTGSTGDSGLVSIGYALVVGATEKVGETPGTPRAAYFPLELRQGLFSIDRRWYQQDYLGKPVVDKEWRGIDVAAELSGDKPNSENDSSDSKRKLLSDIDTLISSEVHAVSANERRKSSLSASSAVAQGSIAQIPEKPRVSYQIRVNSVNLCTLILSKPVYHVGEDLAFFVDLHENDSTATTKVVGFTSHIEAHECYHNAPQGDQSGLTHSYKVTPTIKTNTMAKSMAGKFYGDDNAVVSNFVTIPSHLTQQFQSSSFMDLRYFFVCKFVLNEFAPRKNGGNDTPADSYAAYSNEYKFSNESTDFTVLVPLTVLP